MLYVLDTFALMTYLRREKNHEIVRSILWTPFRVIVRV